MTNKIETNETRPPRRKSCLKKDDDTVEQLSTSSIEISDRSQEIDDLHVQFENIGIRNYDMTLGDNPSCMYGPPVSIDWDYAEEQKVSLDEYELGRGARRESNQMQMNALYRRRLLERDFTADEMQMAEHEIQKIRNGRERTKMLLPFCKLQEAAESAKRKSKRMMAA